MTLGILINMNPRINRFYSTPVIVLLKYPFDQALTQISKGIATTASAKQKRNTVPCKLRR